MGLSRADSPYVSVIVPTRNSAAHLEACLDSIRAQSYANIELIVVDNHSSDRTVEIAKRYGATVLCAGPERSAQVNLGVQAAHGAYVYRVDADFELDETVVQECVTLVNSGADAVVVHNSPREIGWLSRIRKFEVDLYKYSLDHSAARFVSRPLYLRVGGYDADITAGEDYDLQNRLLRAGVQVAFCHAEATHLDEPTRLTPLLLKYYRYGQDFHHYVRRNPERRLVQLGFVRRDFLRHWRDFVRRPVAGFGLVVYHTAKYVAGALGYADIPRRLKRLQSRP